MQLICSFVFAYGEIVFAYGESRFSHDTAHTFLEEGVDQITKIHKLICTFIEQVFSCHG